MEISIEEQIEFLDQNIQESIEIMNIGVSEKDFVIVSINASSIINDYLKIGLLNWRSNQAPQNAFFDLSKFLPKGMNALAITDPESAHLYPLDFFETIYANYLINLPHPPVNIDILEEQPKITGFFGNVLIGADDIANWSKYRDLLPQGKRYDLARQTNELYAGLLAGSISHEEGVKLGEQLWAEREDHPYFDTGTGGYGDDNENMVDYQLGAILKKIGSTVPTVHAWRW